MRQKLERERDKILNKLPGFRSIVQGSIIKRRHVCGKPTCRCKKDLSNWHTSYQISFTEKGKTRTITIPKDRLKEVRQGLQKYKSFRHQVKRVVEINRTLIKKNPTESK